MVEGGEDLRFAVKARHAVRIGGPVARQHLDGDIATKAGIAGAIDLAHAPSANLRNDTVGADRAAGGKGHACRIMSSRLGEPSPTC